jgi:2-keto-4-pentenoate hydratase/2-oxohepta-3-ene-1,7-dioic acid hydratase in catechol pathway
MMATLGQGGANSGERRHNEPESKVRLISYEVAGRFRAGLVLGRDVIDARRAATAAGLDGGLDWSSARVVLSAPPTQRQQLLTSAGHISEDADADVPALDDLVLGPPIPDPDKIICLGLNYRDHADESGLAAPEAPMLFAKYRNSLAGPRDEVSLPAASGKVDYEAELAVVVGRRAKDVSAAEAAEVIGGVMAFNDLTARDLQHQTSQWTAGKAVDGFAPCGPALVTPDELGELQNLRISARVNGRTVQDGTTADMIFTIADTIAFLSRTITLEPGDIIATGTPAGVGVSRDPQILLRDGDIVEVEIEGVGVLSNRMVASTRTSSGDAVTASTIRS